MEFQGKSTIRACVRAAQGAKHTHKAPNSNKREVVFVRKHPLPRPELAVTGGGRLRINSKLQLQPGRGAELIPITVTFGALPGIGNACFYPSGANLIRSIQVLKGIQLPA